MMLNYDVKTALITEEDLHKLHTILHGFFNIGVILSMWRE